MKLTRLVDVGCEQTVCLINKDAAHQNKNTITIIKYCKTNKQPGSQQSFPKVKINMNLDPNPTY